MADVATIRAAADDAVARFGQGVKRIRERGDAARAAMQSAAATVSSPDGAVVATVGADGALTGISFGPSATSLSRETLATRVVETTRRAHAAALAEAAQRVGSIVGADSEPVAILLREHDVLDAAAAARRAVRRGLLRPGCLTWASSFPARSTTS